MKYFSPDFLLFLEEIQANNNKDWFNANKERFKRSVERPFEAFVKDLMEAVEPFLPDLRITARDCIFRFYKDTRFSKGKAPYKTHVSALISTNGRKDKTTLGLYVQFSALDVRLYSGCFEPSSKHLEKIRRHIFENLSEFESLIKDDSFRSKFGEIRGEKYKRLSGPYADIMEEQSLILNKSFYYFKNYPPEGALSPDLLPSLIKDFKGCQALNQFFLRALSQAVAE